MEKVRQPLERVLQLVQVQVFVVWTPGLAKVGELSGMPTFREL